MTHSGAGTAKHSPLRQPPLPVLRRRTPCRQVRRAGSLPDARPQSAPITATTIRGKTARSVYFQVLQFSIGIPRHAQKAKRVDSQVQSPISPLGVLHTLASTVYERDDRRKGGSPPAWAGGERYPGYFFFAVGGFAAFLAVFFAGAFAATFFAMVPRRMPSAFAVLDSPGPGSRRL